MYDVFVLSQLCMIAAQAYQRDSAVDFADRLDGIQHLLGLDPHVQQDRVAGMLKVDVLQVFEMIDPKEVILTILRFG
jgi:hypothetical protein